MSSPAAARILRSASRHSSRLAASASARTGRVFSQQVRATAITRSSIECARCFSTTLRYRAGLMPDQEDPQPPSKVETERTIQQPTDISEETYQIRADEYMEAINEKAEAIQEAREDVEVEYSACLPLLPISTSASAYTNQYILIPGWSSLNNTPTLRHLHHQQAAT